MIVNTERQIRRLNSILLRELGSNPPFSWQYTGSILHPVISVTADESAPGGIRDEYETICECGEGVSVHRPTCQLSIRRKKATMIRIMDHFPDAWVVCQRVYPDETAWNASFGTMSHYPTDGYWFPFTVKFGVGASPIYLKTERGKIPTDEQTSAAILAVSEWRKQNPAEVRYEEQRAAARAKQAQHDNLVGEIKECSVGATLNLLPGKKSNATYASREKDIAPHVNIKPKIYNAQGVPV